MRKWTENTAVSYLNKNGADIRGKIITSSNGLNGLTACSALDFLINHCGYTSRL